MKPPAKKGRSQPPGASYQSLHSLFEEIKKITALVAKTHSKLKKIALEGSTTQEIESLKDCSIFIGHALDDLRIAKENLEITVDKQNIGVLRNISTTASRKLKELSDHESNLGSNPSTLYDTCKTALLALTSLEKIADKLKEREGVDLIQKVTTFAKLSQYCQRHPAVAIVVFCFVVLGAFLGNPLVKMVFDAFNTKDTSPAPELTTKSVILVNRLLERTDDFYSQELISRLEDVCDSLKTDTVQISGSGMFISLADTDSEKQRKIVAGKNLFDPFKGIVAYGYYNESSKRVVCVLDISALSHKNQTSTTIKINTPSTLSYSTDAQIVYVAKFIMGVLHAQSGDPATAVSFLTSSLGKVARSTDQRKQKEDIHLLLGIANLRSGNLEAATIHFDSSKLDIATIQKLVSDTVEYPRDKTKHNVWCSFEWGIQAHDNHQYYYFPGLAISADYVVEHPTLPCVFFIKDVDHPKEDLYGLIDISSSRIAGDSAFYDYDGVHINTDYDSVWIREVLGKRIYIVAKASKFGIYNFVSTRATRYDNFPRFEKDGFSIISFNKKYGIIHGNLGSLVEPIYDSVTVFSSSNSQQGSPPTTKGFILKKNNLYGYVKVSDDVKSFADPKVIYKSKDEAYRNSH